MKKVLMLPVLRHFLDAQNYSIVKKKIQYILIY